MKEIVANKDPRDTTVGVAYMLVGDAPVANADTFATGCTNDANRVTGFGAQLMIPINNTPQ